MSILFFFLIQKSPSLGFLSVFARVFSAPSSWAGQSGCRLHRMVQLWPCVDISSAGMVIDSFYQSAIVFYGKSPVESEVGGRAWHRNDGTGRRQHAQLVRKEGRGKWRLLEQLSVIWKESPVVFAIIKSLRKNRTYSMIYTSIHRYKFGIRADATAGGRDANSGRQSFRRKLHSLPFTSFGDGSLTRLSASPSASPPRIRAPRLCEVFNGRWNGGAHSRRLSLQLTHSFSNAWLALASLDP